MLKNFKLLGVALLSVCALALSSCGSDDDDVQITPAGAVGAVDLGLSVKWASCNLGAFSPEQSGDYYAWGEITPKSPYIASNSQFHSVVFSKSSVFEKYVDMVISWDYNLMPAYDAASCRLGGKWRMPTSAECAELKNKCAWEWTTINGVNGYVVTGPNGNSIFLPAAGARDGDNLKEGKEELEDYNVYGNYWSSTVEYYHHEYYNSCEWSRCLVFASPNYIVTAYTSRYVGCTIRPVSE